MMNDSKTPEDRGEDDARVYNLSKYREEEEEKNK